MDLLAGAASPTPTSTPTPTPQVSAVTMSDLLQCSMIAFVMAQLRPQLNETGAFQKIPLVAVNLRLRSLKYT